MPALRHAVVCWPWHDKPLGYERVICLHHHSVSRLCRRDFDRKNTMNTRQIAHSFQPSEHVGKCALCNQPQWKHKSAHASEQEIADRLAKEMDEKGISYPAKTKEYLLKAIQQSRAAHAMERCRKCGYEIAGVVCTHCGEPAHPSEYDFANWDGSGDPPLKPAHASEQGADVDRLIGAAKIHLKEGSDWSSQLLREAVDAMRATPATVSEHECTYSRQIDQPYPRHCIVCGKVESQTGKP